jgi:hypothetical protein
MPKLSIQLPTSQRILLCCQATDKTSSLILKVCIKPVGNEA